MTTTKRPSANPTDTFVNTRRAAEILGIAPRTLYHHIQSGSLPASKLDGGGKTSAWIIRRSDVDAFKARRDAAPYPQPGSDQ